MEKALENTQKELSAISGSVSAGGHDLRKEVAKLLRDARRGVEKMRTTVRRDLERIQKDPSKDKPREQARTARRSAR